MVPDGFADLLTVENVAAVIAAATSGAAAGGYVKLRRLRGELELLTAQARQAGAQADGDLADAVAVLLGGARELVQPLRDELAAATARHEHDMAAMSTRYEREIGELRTEVSRLTEQNAELRSEVTTLRLSQRRRATDPG